MKRTTKQIIGYFGVYLFLGATNSALSPLLPAISDNLKISLANVGSLVTLRSLGYLIGSLVFGWLFDRISGNRLMAITVLILAGVVFFLPNAASLVMISGAMFLLGYLQSGLDVGSNILLINTNARGMQGLLNGLFFTAGIGGFLAPALLSAASISGGMTILASLLIPLSVWLLITPSPELSQHDPAQVDKPRLPDGFWSFAGIAFILIGLEVGFGSWIFTYYLEKGFGADENAYLLTSIFWLAVTAGRLITIFITEKIDTSKRIFISLGIGLFSAAAVIIKINTPIFLWAGTIGIGLGLSALFPTLIGYLQEKQKLSGKQSGLIWSMGSFGAMVIPWLMGYRMDLAGPDTMISMTAIAIAFALALFTIIYRSRRMRGKS